MYQKSAPHFNLANGYCYVLPQYIVITDSHDVNAVLRKKDTNVYSVFTLFFLMVLVGFLLGGNWLYQIGKTQDSVYLFVCAILSLYFLLRWRKRSNQNVIEREKVLAINMKKVMLNPAFVITFKDKKGKIKERVLMMEAKGFDQITNALQIFKQEKLFDKIQTIYKPVAEKSFKNAGECKVEVEPKAISQETQKTKPEQIKKEDPYVTKPATKSPKRDANGYVKEY
ncbi:MAG: hypothetical protein IPM74_17640 [Crocinitomicaceae bacterium]|nr:hypothetical protein [Crocinitomicaceae bacterium]MBK8927670.1 hypothetical protein [Crocinitomicaceae bacterium]